MKSLINIDKSDLLLAKELYLMQSYGNYKVDNTILKQIDNVIKLLGDSCVCNMVDGVFNLYFKDGFAFIKEGNLLAGNNVSTRLKGAKKAYFFIVTLGKDVDRLIDKYQYVDLSTSYLIDGLASVLIDVISQKIQDKISENYYIYERYSCGYGDYLLSCQANICTLLKADKIGVNLTNGGMFIPTKTISAVIGIKGEKNV